MRIFEVAADPFAPTTHPIPFEPRYKGYEGMPQDSENHDPEWDNKPRVPKMEWHEPRVKDQHQRALDWIKRRSDALKHEDHLLSRQIEDYVDGYGADDPEKNVVIGAFPDPQQEDYPYETGDPPEVKANAGAYVGFKVDGSWFMEDMRTGEQGRGDEGGPSYDDAYEIWYVKKTFKYFKKVEALIKRHIQIQKLLSRSWAW